MSDNVVSNKFASLGRPNSGGGARPRLRTGYHSAVIKTDMKIGGGTSANGRPAVAVDSTCGNARE